MQVLEIGPPTQQGHNKRNDQKQLNFLGFSGSDSNHAPRMLRQAPWPVQNPNHTAFARVILIKITENSAYQLS